MDTFTRQFLTAYLIATQEINSDTANKEKKWRIIIADEEKYRYFTLENVRTSPFKAKASRGLHRGELEAQQCRSLDISTWIALHERQDMLSLNCRQPTVVLLVDNVDKHQKNTEICGANK